MSNVASTGRPPTPWDSLALALQPRGEGLQGMLDALALSTTAMPGVGDVAGLAADGYRFATDPSSRTWGNAGWASLGLLPFVPSMGAVTRAAGKTADALDMSKDARMARAAEQGFTIDAFKGAYPYDYRTGPTRNWKGEEIDQIGSVPEPLVSFDAPNSPFAGFFSGDRKVASRFGELFDDGAVFPVKLKFKNPVELDARGKPAASFQFESVARQHGTQENLSKFQKAFDDPKVDGVIVHNTADEGTVYIPRKPQQVRSVHAAFDPAKRNSGDLLASLAAAGLFGGAAARLYDGEQ